MIVCLEEVQLKIGDDVNKTYIAMSTVKLDSEKIEEGFYSSKLMLYDIEPGSKQFKVAVVETFKMTITCLSHYRGHLVAVILENKVRDRHVVFYKFDGKAKLEAKVQPQSNENLGISISFDGDLIFLGDAYNNIRVLKVTDSESLKAKERVEDPNKFISVKRMCSNKMNEKVIGIFTLRASERNDYSHLSQVEKQSFSLLSVSESGYLRLYCLREKKLLECVAQISMQDQVIKIIPVPYDLALPVN